MSPKISIIVPIYNAQKTIERCIDSILNQDFSDFELILIDMGARTIPGKYVIHMPERISVSG